MLSNLFTETTTLPLGLVWLVSVLGIVASILSAYLVLKDSRERRRLAHFLKRHRNGFWWVDADSRTLTMVNRGLADFGECLPAASYTDLRMAVSMKVSRIRMSYGGIDVYVDSAWLWRREGKDHDIIALLETVFRVLRILAAQKYHQAFSGRPLRIKFQHAMGDGYDVLENIESRKRRYSDEADCWCELTILGDLREWSKVSASVEKFFERRQDSTQAAA